MAGEARVELTGKLLLDDIRKASRSNDLVKIIHAILPDVIVNAVISMLPIVFVITFEQRRFSHITKRKKLRRLFSKTL